MKAIRIIGLLLVIAFAFAGGYVYKAVKGGAASTSKGGRKVLYWVDPMHPAYKSDKPGIAPDCGMKLEPVYADGGAAAAPAGANRRVLYYRDPKARAAEILGLRLFADQAETLDQLGKRYDVTRERVRQIEGKARGALLGFLG